MAIYTEYGRYVKAKLFKKAAESGGGIYMLLCLGNPHWDAKNSVGDSYNQPMPIASYNTAAVTTDGSQFEDSNIQQYFYNSANDVIQTVASGKWQSNSYGDYFKDLLPPFPSIWQYTNSNTISIVDGVNQSDFYKHVIISSGGNFYLDKVDEASKVEIPGDTLLKQYFAEMYLRGLGVGANLVKQPVGLFGAIKCDISFVRSIDSSQYNSDINQFWYGDRYWEVVDPNDEKAESNEYRSDDGDKKELVYPHHLLFTAVVNPKTLCPSNTQIDNALVPMQIALYSKLTEGKSYYRVGDNIFNFGQFSESDISGLSSDSKNKLLNFTLPKDGYPAGDFEFILHDYIKGFTRDAHTVDRIGYIVGF